MTIYIYVFCQETIITIVSQSTLRNGQVGRNYPEKGTREMRRVNYCNVFNTRSGRGERKMSVALN